LVRAQIQRLFAVLVGSPIVIVAYLITRLLFPADQAMRLTIPALVAFHPMITEITAVVSVDGLLIVCYSVLIYLSLRVFRDGFNWRYGLAIGGVFAFGMLIKPTLNGYAPLIALLLIYDWWRSPARCKEIVKAAALMAVVIAVPVGWWMQRSWRLNGDLFYFNPVVEGHRIINNPYYDYTFWPHLVDYYQSVWGGIFTTWWAHFGWLDTALPPWVYHLLRLLTALAIIGLTVRLAQIRRRPLPSKDWAKGEGVAPLVVWLFLALSIVVPIVLLQVYDLTFWWQYGNGRGLQGRYWLGTVVPMLTFFTLGLLFVTPRCWHAAVHTWLRIGMVVLNLVALLGYILPRYYL
ncbi:MAG TPA: glycosyltransferase family 39 protein, partial [Anaerolineae bacterium]